MCSDTIPGRYVGLFLILAVLLSFTIQNKTTAETLNLDELTANKIMNRMSEVYGNSRSYSDSGVVRIVFIHPDRKYTVEKPFTTAFIRPDRFRFEYREKKQYVGEQRFIVHLQGNDVQMYWDVDKELKYESLDRAIASAAGVSGGSAIRIPAMLLPSEITWRRAIRFRQPKRLGDDVLDGVDCFRISDVVLGAIPTTIWIDKKTYLLKKVHSEQEFEDFRTQRTTIYAPILNGSVEDNMLEFGPPKDKSWWQFW